MYVGMCVCVCVSMCVCVCDVNRSPHCVYWCSCAQELPPATTSQETVQSQGEARQSDGKRE